jgi:hypothetical protein
VRTTVTLDPDAEQIIRERMEARGVSFKRALNDAIRESGADRLDVGFSSLTFDMGPPKIDLTKANQIAGELEDEAIIEKMRQGR